MIILFNKSVGQVPCHIVKYLSEAESLSVLDFSRPVMGLKLWQIESNEYF
jgi:hypothetical protein